MSKTLKVGVLSAGFLLVGTAAHAADNFTSTGNVGLGNGNQVKALIQAPIDVCGNAISVLGTANAWCKGGAHAVLHDAGDTNLTSTGNVGLLNGNQVDLVAQVPVNVCGNAIAVLGSGSAGCEGGASAVIEQPGRDGGPTPSPYGHKPPMHHKPHQKPGHKPNKPKQELLGFDGLLGGILATSSDRTFAPPHMGGSCDVTLTSTGNVGLLNGNQVVAPIQAPIDISGNAISVLGGPSTASSMGGASAVMC
jgi:hypothetical protein